MKSLLVHGCYDQHTLKTLVSLGVSEFGFDLRGRSSNLIPFHHLKILLADLASSEIILMFENDRPTTILSFLNLLQDEKQKIILEFRDNLPSTFYQSIDHPFYWMFCPESDWKEILYLPQLKGILLPLKWQEHYHRLPELWETIDKLNLKIMLHADSFSETALVQNRKDVELSLDLTSEIETSFRMVDQEKLRNQKFWGGHENITLQR